MNLSGRHPIATNKTIATSADVEAFIKTIADERQQADALSLCALMARISGEPATMWGSSIIGFGTYHYKYESGRKGDSLRIGFSPRKGKTVVYLVDGFSTQDAHLAKLGKHKRGKSCLYITRLADVDMAVLEAMITASLRHVATLYP